MAILYHIFQTQNIENVFTVADITSEEELISPYSFLMLGTDYRPFKPYTKDIYQVKRPGA